MEDNEETHNNNESSSLEMDGKTFRWVVAAVAAVIVTCTLGCTVAYVTHPKEFVCVTSSISRCEEAGGETR